MSGLCGIVDRTSGPIDPRILQTMLEAGAHRGPDGTGTWHGEGISLGHLALHVTPEDRHERQPLANSALAVIADARIDNRDDLARTLGLGAERGPARLILEAFRRFGPACPEHLLGDFAFAVWDSRERRLLLARDPMAMRPLYYRLTERQLLFASEIAQLLACQGVPTDLDEGMVAAHLTGQPMPLERTFYQGIAQLPPGHALLLEPGRHRAWRFWDIDPGHRIRYRRVEDYAAHFRELFEDAVRCRLHSDYPVGLMLSGGVDSGCVAATAGWLLENQRERVRTPAFLTYSFAYEHLPACDERRVSRLITDRYALPAIDIPANDAHPLADYPQHGPGRDAPTVRIYQALHERVFARAREDGARTMMAGYRGDLLVGFAYDHLGLLAAGRWREVLRQLRAESRSWRRMPKVTARHLILPALMPLWPRSVLAAARRRLWARVTGARPVPPYPDWLSRDLVRRVGLAELAAPVEAPPRLRASARRARYEAVFLELHMRSLVDLERNQQQFGLALADPWSDRRLAEYVLAVPQAELHRPGEYKRLARRAMNGVMPEEARQRVGKVTLQPFAVDTLRRAAVPTILDLLTDSEAAARGYVDADRVRALYEAIRRGTRGTAGIWEILTLEIWLRRHCRRGPGMPTPRARNRLVSLRAYP